VHPGRSDLRHVHQLGSAAGAARHPPCGMVGAAAGAQMSVVAMRRVWVESTHSGSSLLMLLAIADHAHDDGGGAYPSVARLAAQCRMKPRNARVILAELRRSGELEVTEGAGPRGANMYRLTLAAGVQRLAGVHSDAGGAAKECREPLQDLAAKPLRNHQEPSGGVASQPAAPVPASKSGKRRPKVGAKDMTLAQWIAELDGADAVPPGDPIFAYAESIGLPPEFLELAWRAFRRRYLEEQAAKTYADWRAVFRNAVRGNWLRLWFADPAGGFRLTTAGTQALRERDAQHSSEEVDHA
jgi:hypothetical protein